MSNYTPEELATMDETLRAQEGALGGDAFDAARFCSIRDGFPPQTENTAVLDPETHRIEVLSGQIPDEQRIHHTALEILIDAYGPQQEVTARMAKDFSNSAAGPNDLAALFKNDPAPPGRTS
ncbi:MAG: hypothetical protein R3E13_08205 [Alphaproteobacteria bacterium]